MLNGKRSSGMRIAYVGPFVYPNDSAEARHIDGISRILSLAGSSITVIAGDSAIRGDAETHATGEYQVHHVDELPTRSASPVKRLYRYLSYGHETVNWLNTHRNEFDAVLLFGGFSAYAIKLLNWAAQTSCPLIVDVVEWFDPSQLPGGWGGPIHVRNELALRHYFVRIHNIIAISSFLENYYVRRGCRVVRIPPVFDTTQVPYRTTVVPGTKSLTLAYAGSPGKKDNLSALIEALMTVNSQNVRVKLVLAGVTISETLKMAIFRERGITTSPAWLTALGRVSATHARDIVRDADYSVLFRPNKKYATAGFSTKVVESLAVGTPILCNLSGDLGRFLNDGREALICRDQEVNAIEDALRRALDMDDATMRAMRCAARRRAERDFDVRQYIPVLESFIEGVQAR